MAVQRTQSEAETRLAEMERALAAVREDSEVAYVLLGLSGALAEVRSVGETLELAVRTSAELFGADRCAAASWDDVNDRFEVLAHWGYGDGPVVEDFPYLRQALAEKQPVMISNSPSEGAVISIPLVRWGEDFGGLRLEFDRPREFGDKDLALARGVARQVGVALNNARRFRLLEVLHNFGMTIGGSLPLSKVVGDTIEGTIELLSADAAWVYLLDPSRRLLVSAGGRSSGLALPERLARVDLSEEPWSELVRGEPVMVPRLGERFGDDRDLVGVATPLFSAGAWFNGALLAVFERSRAPSPDELEAFRVLAVQSSQSIENARRYERERSVARSLQKGLLSVDVPDLDGFEIEALYETTESDVGGDLYDVFQLPDGRCALVVGDVSGKGAEAAAQTAMVKYTLRAFATQDPLPSSVIDQLNESLVRDLPEDRFVTLVYALFDPSGGHFEITVAGHPAPLIYRTSGDVETIPSHGTIVGALSGERYGQSGFDLDPGELLIAYTDGLVEIRSNGELFGTERLHASLRDRGKDPIGIARGIFEDARRFGEISDDTIVLSLARSPHHRRR